MKSEAEVSRALLEVAQSVATQCDLRTLLVDLTGSLRKFASFDRLSLILQDPEREAMRLHSVAVLDPTSATVGEVPPAETTAFLAWQIQQPLVVPRIAGETRFPVLAGTLRGAGMRSCCALPLNFGSLIFASAQENAFDENAVQFLQLLITQVAMSIGTVRHHEAAERSQREVARERDRLRLLLEVNNTLVSNLEPLALFHATISTLRKIIPHEYAGLMIYDEERKAFDLRVLEFAGKGLLTERMTLAAEGTPAGIAYAAGRPIRFEREDLEALSGDFVTRLLAEGVQSVCSVPLTVRDRRLGTLNVGRLSGERFTAEDAELLAAVANQVAFAVENSLAHREIAALGDRIAAKNVSLQKELRTTHNFEDFIGDTPVLSRLLETVETVALTSSTVLIRGETGTGKELIACAIHNRSERRERAFVKVNCAAIPAGLLESELFGHERGAFTGATSRRVGRFELADGGTLFLDEIGDIPTELQPKLLRVLQDQEFERLGATRTLHVDVRVVAATHRDLEQMVEDGTFRCDLYYRLNVFPIHVPPLRERRADIPLLVNYFTQRLARRINKSIDHVPADAMAALCAYHWPGNVRELENVIERAVVLTRGPALRVPVSELHLRASPPPVSHAEGTMAAAECDVILRALDESRWVIGGAAGAAARLGMKRTSLQSRMRKLGISRPRR